MEEFELVTVEVPRFFLKGLQSEASIVACEYDLQDLDSRADAMVALAVRVQGLRGEGREVSEKLDLEAIETRWDCQQHHWDKGLTAEGQQFMDVDAPALLARVRQLEGDLEEGSDLFGIQTRALQGAVKECERLEAALAVAQARVTELEGDIAERFVHASEVGQATLDEKLRCLAELHAVRGAYPEFTARKALDQLEYHIRREIEADAL